MTLAQELETYIRRGKDKGFEKEWVEGICISIVKTISNEVYATKEKERST